MDGPKAYTLSGPRSKRNPLLLKKYTISSPSALILDSAPEKKKKIAGKYIPWLRMSTNHLPNVCATGSAIQKNNGYEALHTTVMGPQGKWVEVQIRSKRMNDRRKRFGSTLQYKEGSHDEGPALIMVRPDPRSIKYTGYGWCGFFTGFQNIFSCRRDLCIYPKRWSENVAPPASTALDFAFSIHSAIGSNVLVPKCITNWWPISHKLRSGDQVEIITSNNKTIRRLARFVVTAKAKSKIKDALREEKENSGRRQITPSNGKWKRWVPIQPITILRNLVQFYKLPSPLDLHYKIATRTIDLKELKDFHVLAIRSRSQNPNPLLQTVQTWYSAKEFYQERIGTHHFWREQR